MLETRWDDIRIAWQVAESGSLSRAGEQLGMNHSTVLRHVNRVEERLGLRRFIGHQGGYRLTDAGQLLLEKMRPIVADMQRLQGSLSTLDATPSGTLRISTVSDFSGFFTPLLHEFREQYPQVRVQIVATDDVLPLASGEVHVAIRMGAEPQEPDLVARPLLQARTHYYASADYLARYGQPQSLADINRHWWVMPSGEKRRISGIRQLLERLDPSQIAFQSNSFTDIHSAVREGMGIGPVGGLQRVQWQDETLQRVEFGLNSEPAQMWFVYHKDMRRSARVQALQSFLQQRLPALQQRLL